jgi:hypothetical protein
MIAIEGRESRVEGQKRTLYTCYWHSTLDPRLSTVMHTIRLRGPWQLEPVWRYVLQADGTYRTDREDLPEATRVTMPADWSAVYGADFLGRVRYHRVFQKPTGLDSGERVWLVVEPAQSEACVTLKGRLVGFVYPGEPTGRFDITDRLEDHNQLDIVVDHPAVELITDHPVPRALQSKVGDPRLLSPGGLVGEVRLEIED